MVHDRKRRRRTCLILSGPLQARKVSPVPITVSSLSPRPSGRHPSGVPSLHVGRDDAPTVHSPSLGPSSKTIRPPPLLTVRAENHWDHDPWSVSGQVGLPLPSDLAEFERDLIRVGQAMREHACCVT